MLAFVLKDVWS